MPETQKQPSRDAGRIRLFHILVIGLSLALTLSAWEFSKRQVERRTQLLFEAARDQTLSLIVDRMHKYEDALWAGVAAVDSHGGAISYPAWQTFARRLRIEERYPGINGIGVTHYLTPQNLEAYLADQRRQRPGFRVHPGHDIPFYMPITFIEPEAENAAAVGLDLAHEDNRRTAALASRDTGAARITGPITLVQDAGQTPGFLFYAPIYRGGPQDDIAGRRARFLGTVYAPFVVHKLMEGLLARDLRAIRFDIRDGDQMIFRERVRQDPLRDPDPMFAQQVSLPLYGRTWTLDIETDLIFRENHNLSKPTLILVAGLFIEGLILILLFQISRARGQAVRYADRVTAVLREKSTTLAARNLELAEKNEELERFAYVASHDLRTPLRGIGGLTEMIEEDLEAYFSAPSANPDVQANLTRIHDRVQRMNDLTRGIMDYAQVGAKVQEDAPLILQEMIETIVFDFNLAAGQLRLDGDVAEIRTDPFQFRQVLENLVGNAIKYHDGMKALEIVVCVQSDQDRCTVSVTDNGPGIAAEFHDRIFDVFQTLRAGNAPESTGIGLSIVKKSVEHHGGTIKLTSSLGAGAIFTFDWPNRGSSQQMGQGTKAA